MAVQDRTAYRQQYRLDHNDSLRKQSLAYYYAHREALLEHNRLWKRANTEKIQKTRHIYAQKHRLDLRNSHNLYYHKKGHIHARLMAQQLKLEVFSHYSQGTPKCFYCGATDLDTLCLDHVYNDGAFERHVHKIGTSTSYWRKVKAMNYPDRYQKLKHTIIDHYSNGLCCCTHCGERNFGALTIDHINNDGAAQRSAYKLGGGHTFYSWLRHNKFPDGFQVLCFNCNLGKYARGGKL